MKSVSTLFRRTYPEFDSDLNTYDRFAANLAGLKRQLRFAVLIANVSGHANIA